jgi:hypothetical protein
VRLVVGCRAPRFWLFLFPANALHRPFRRSIRPESPPPNKRQLVRLTTDNRQVTDAARPIASYLWVLAVGLATSVMAWGSAHNYAGGWNDGSRLATVESLVDYRTWAIDRSIFVHAVGSRSPYRDNALLKSGTLDKLWINGHYYSDKSPVPALLMAGLYQACEWTTGLTAAASAEQFCFLMTFATSGLAYVVACLCVFLMSCRAGLSTRHRLVLTASFALATVCTAYVRHVNNHIVFLGVIAPIVLGLVDWSFGVPPSSRQFAAWGFLTGLAYTIDLGAGPVLLLTIPIVVFRYSRSFKSPAIIMISALPWFALHHFINYRIGGTLTPANSVAAYFQWPGCPFDNSNMTGGWHHADFRHFAVYSAGLLVGKRGFWSHNPALYLAAGAAFAFAWVPARRSPLLLFTWLWCGGTWLLYAVSSNNWSGSCCSIRWFVPFLAPAYGILALALAEWPDRLGDLAVLSAVGTAQGILMWREGPWMTHMVPGFWLMQAAVILGWATYRYQNRRRRIRTQPLTVQQAA